MKDNLVKTEIGQRIRQLRLLSDLTQAEFAEAIDISINFLSEIENGKKGVSGDTLAKICRCLNTSADFILFGKQEKRISFLESANALSIEELETTIRYLQALIEMKKIL
ncbi:MAG: helix-turn-helix transcriptional regulator [Roseburia sp.]|nr:helix-turn-helix transcriptional regulator [Roseburia sp.]